MEEEEEKPADPGPVTSANHERSRSRKKEEEEKAEDLLERDLPARPRRFFDGDGLQLVLVSFCPI